MSDMDKQELEELQRGSTFGERDDESDPYREQRDAESAAEQVDPMEQMFDCLVDVREGERTPSLGGRDELFAAYLDFLKANPERMEEVCEKLASQLEHPPKYDPEQKASLVLLLLRVGLQSAAPEEYEFLSEANAEYARRKL